MNGTFYRLLALLLVLITVSSCGTTIYRKNVYNSKKYSNYKQRHYAWHGHHYRPRAHAGGYW